MPKMTAGALGQLPRRCETSTRRCRDMVNPHESTHDENEEEQTTLVSSLCPMMHGSHGYVVQPNLQQYSQVTRIAGSAKSYVKSYYY